VDSGDFDSAGEPSISGYGQAAWITNTNGTASMEVLDGKYVVAITSNRSEAVVEKAARLVLSQ
jgi:hypothetical protein